MTEDDHTKPKLFCLAGFNNQPDVKSELEVKIRSLGGEIYSGAGWSERVSHVVANSFIQYPERVMAGLVSGCWVITRRFIDRSFDRGGWANTKVFSFHCPLMYFGLPLSRCGSLTIFF